MGNGSSSVARVRQHRLHHTERQGRRDGSAIDVRRPTSAHVSAGTIINVCSVCDRGRIGNVTITSNVDTTDAIAHVLAPSRSGPSSKRCVPFFLSRSPCSEPDLGEPAVRPEREANDDGRCSDVQAIARNRGVPEADLLGGKDWRHSASDRAESQGQHCQEGAHESDRRDDGGERRRRSQWSEDQRVDDDPEQRGEDQREAERHREAHASQVEPVRDDRKQLSTCRTEVDEHIDSPPHGGALR